MKYIQVKYVQEVTDRYGRKHLYFRRDGFPRARLDGLPGSKEFAQSYQDALDGISTRTRPGQRRTLPGTFAELLAKYYDSLEFRSLQPKTQTNYRRVLMKIEFLSDIPVRALDRQQVLELRDTGNTIALMKRLKTLMNFAIERGYREDNPADKVKILGKRRPFRPWTDKDIKTYLEHYEPDGRENLAITLLLYTGARRSDVVTFGWENINGNVLTFVPIKTSHLGEEPKRLFIPLHSVLARRIASLPKGDKAFLMTQYGEPFAEESFSIWFRKSAQKAGLPKNSSPHGLRKAASRKLAEAGCTVHEIASITGHSSLKEVERYTASAAQAKLARSAMRLIDKTEP